MSGGKKAKPRRTALTEIRVLATKVDQALVQVRKVEERATLVEGRMQKLENSLITALGENLKSNENVVKELQRARKATERGMVITRELVEKVNEQTEKLTSLAQIVGDRPCIMNGRCE